MERVSASTFSMTRRHHRHVALGFDFDFDWSITAYGLATQAANSSISSKDKHAYAYILYINRFDVWEKNPVSHHLILICIWGTGEMGIDGAYFNMASWLN